MEFSVSACLRFGWETFKKRPWFLIFVFPIMFLVIICAVAVSAAVAAGIAIVFAHQQIVMVAPILLVVAGLVWAATALLMGYVSIALKAHDDVKAVSYRDLWHPRPFWKFFGARILYKLVTVLGLVLLIVPGLFWLVMYVFTEYIVIERNLGPIEAMKESARITRGSRWELALLIALVAIINVFGYYLLFVGMFVTVPVTMLALVHAYRILSGKADAIVPESA